MTEKQRAMPLDYTHAEHRDSKGNVINTPVRPGESFYAVMRRIQAAKAP